MHIVYDTPCMQGNIPLGLADDIPWDAALSFPDNSLIPAAGVS